MTVRDKRQGVYAAIAKPILDRVLSLIGLIALSWLYLLIALAIVIDDPGPVLFRQKRIGKSVHGHQSTFTIYKFRTMRSDSPHDIPTHLMCDSEQWITRVGRFLRKTSLDELPQLWNIAITHDLSLVGPRPALWNQQDLFDEREKYGANDVLPGLTGWAQINGRDELSIPEKARRDGEYVQKLSFAFDLKCFFGTFRAVLRADGVVEGGEESGNNP